MVLGCAGVRAQDAKDVVTQMVAREDAAASHREHFFYVATERSDRTGGHLWQERVAETTAGKVRFLIAEDGQPLSADRVAKERGRLAGIVADPTGFAAAEAAKKNDEDKAKAMLDLLPKAFLLDNERRDEGMILVDFKPDPGYRTQSMEEKVLHGMAGTVTIDAEAMRLHHIVAEMPQDVSVGFGLVSVRAGSHFETVRDMVSPGQWKTVLVDTRIDGKALLFKSLGRNEHVERTGIKLLPFGMTVAEAVALVEE
jgi:hypothetical protein